MVSSCFKHMSIAAVLLAGNVLLATSASAMTVCWVKKTPDGFVALRAQPSPEGKLIAQMRGGDVVWGDPDSKVKPRKGWLYINWVKQSTHEKTGGVTVKIDGKGWVRESLIEDECG